MEPASAALSDLLTDKSFGGGIAFPLSVEQSPAGMRVMAVTEGEDWRWDLRQFEEQQRMRWGLREVRLQLLTAPGQAQKQMSSQRLRMRCA